MGSSSMARAPARCGGDVGYMWGRRGVDADVDVDVDADEMYMLCVGRGGWVGWVGRCGEMRRSESSSAARAPQVHLHSGGTLLLSTYLPPTH